MIWAFVITVYAAVALGWIALRITWAARAPETMPGGKIPSIVVVAFLWPLVVVFVVLGLLLLALDDL